MSFLVKLIAALIVFWLASYLLYKAQYLRADGKPVAANAFVFISIAMVIFQIILFFR